MLGKISKVGIYFLMISFGASFGFTVMGRISLLIGRFDDLIKFSSFDFYYGTIGSLIFVVIILVGYFSMKNNNNVSDNI